MKNTLILLISILTISTGLGNDIEDGFNIENIAKRIAGSKYPCFLFGDGEDKATTMHLAYEYGFNEYSRNKHGADFFSLFYTDFDDLNAKSFAWTGVQEKDVEVESALIAVRNNHKIVQYTYFQPGEPSMTFGFILVRETSQGWCRPFLIARTEPSSTGLRRFSITVLSKDDLPLAVTATLFQDGTGAHRSHILIDLSRNTPRLVATAFGYRVRSQDYSSSKDYRSDVREMNRRESIATGE